METAVDARGTTTYVYDALYRLESETITDATNGNRSTTWTYDAVGNRQSETRVGGTNAGLTTYGYNDNDWLLSETVDGVLTSYTYDSNGNTETKVTNGIETANYLYDSEDRMTVANITDSGLTTATFYAYDVSGTRQSQTTSGETTTYLVDPNRSYAQVIEETHTLDGLTRLYTYGDDLISQSRISGGNTANAAIDVYLYDGLGSVRSLASDTGSITDTYVYQAFGDVEVQNGTTANRYLYTGEQYDPNVGFYYLRARYYNPSIGRFQTMDTYAGRMHEPATLHKYLYVHADPVNMVDPSGNVGTASGLSAATTISAILTTASVAGTALSIYSAATDDDGITATEIGWTVVILAAGPIAGKALKGLAAARAIRVAEAALKSGKAASLFLKSGRTSEMVLRRFIPTNAKNTFRSNARITAGFKYRFKVGSVKVEIKWHSPDLEAARRFPGSNSATMWTAQIKIGNKLLGTDGKMYRRPRNETHIPIDIF